MISYQTNFSDFQFKGVENAFNSSDKKQSNNSILGLNITTHFILKKKKVIKL